MLKGSMKTVVALPRYVDQGEWLALNSEWWIELKGEMLMVTVFEFFEYLRIFNGVVQEFCTHKSCPTMSAGPR